MSHQTKWYPYLNKEDTAKPGQTLFSHHQPEPGTIIVCQELEYRSYTKFPSYSNFGIYLFGSKATHRCFYEIIIGGQCPYVDFDALTEGHDDDPDEIEAYVDEVSTRCKEGTVNSATVMPFQRKMLEDLRADTRGKGNFGGDDVTCANVPTPAHKTTFTAPVLSDMGAAIRDQVLRLSGLAAIPTPDLPTGIPNAECLQADRKTPSPTHLVPKTGNYTTTPPGQKGYKPRPKLVLSPDEAKEAILALKVAIIKTCPLIKEENIMIFSSHSNKKQSFHLKVDGWCFPDHQENKAFMREVLKNYPEKWHGGIDMSMYKTIQQFRVYGCHKWGQDARIKSFRPDLCSWRLNDEPFDDAHEFGMYLLSSLITNIGSCIPLPSFIPKEEKAFTIRSEETAVHLKPEDVNDVIGKACTIAGVTLDHFPYKVEKVNGGLITLRRLKPSMCRVCEREHEHENPCIYVVGTERHIYFDCRRNEDGRKTHLGCLGYAVPDVIIPGTDMGSIMAMLAGYTTAKTGDTSPVQELTVVPPLQMVTMIQPVIGTVPMTGVPRTPSPPARLQAIPIPDVPTKVVPVTKHVVDDLNSKIHRMRQLSATYAIRQH
jgi:hypothetical protein